LFAELKNQIGLRRLRLRRLRFVREQFFLAAVAQNLKRLWCASSARRQHPSRSATRKRNQKAAVPHPTTQKHFNRVLFQHPSLI
jgi:Transposase DDE domain